MTEEKWAWLDGSGPDVRGEGSSVMVEWSEPMVIAIVRVLDHLKTDYGIFDNVRGDRKNKKWMNSLPSVDLELQFTDINVFLYALTPGKLQKCAFLSLYMSIFWPLLMSDKGPYLHTLI